MDIQEFKKIPVLGILRGIQTDEVEGVVEASCAGGLKTLEITLNTPDAFPLIKNMVNVSAGRLTVGAGTILTLDDTKKALDAGATFIVSPVFDEEVVSFCVSQNIPVFPGALTPKEIYQAWKAGAAMVKVFPAKSFGPSYLKEVKGPFDTIELLACGGVTPENVSEFFSCGASAVAFGASIFKQEYLSQKNFTAIESEIAKLIAACHMCF